LETLEIRYTGKVSEGETVPVTRAVLKGLLCQTSEGVINEVNAPRVAANLGLKVTETKQVEAVEFADLITVEATKGGELYEVAATVFAGQPRIVRINGRSLEANPAGILLFVENQDRPGMLGAIGTALAKHQINIGNMSLGRGEAGGNALSVYNLDTRPNDAAIKEIEGVAGIVSVKIAQL
jgi:D-3-phosphoglycerate dehydrogenase